MRLVFTIFAVLAIGLTGAPPEADAYNYDAPSRVAAATHEATGVASTATVRTAHPCTAAHVERPVSRMSTGVVCAAPNSVLAAGGGAGTRKTFTAAGGTEITGFTRHGITLAGGVVGKLGKSVDRIRDLSRASRLTPAAAAATVVARSSLDRARSALARLRGRFGANTAGGGPGKVVIGEGMERVRARATREGAETYEPGWLPPAERMPRNRDWINQKMDEGCLIIDCGPAPGRTNFPDPTSPYYKMELEEIAKRGYDRYQPPGGG